MIASQLRAALARITAQWDPDIFENGDCHTLALALHQSSAPADLPDQRVGSLWACIRESVDEHGNCVERGYSHMIYSPEDGSSWDIRGPEADIRWEGNYDQDARDKWGLRTRLTWEKVPCSHPLYCDTHIWLQEYFGAIDNVLQGKLVCEIRKSQEIA